MNIPKFKEDLEEIYKEVTLIESGNVANYIPQLAMVNKDLFGISVCTVDGHIINIGDTKEEFSLQSCSKVLTYLLACRDNGSNNIHKHVGREPSGKAFNDFCFNEDNLPHNPMINSGALMTISMINPEANDMSNRYNNIRDFMKKMAGHVGYLGYDNSIYLSERGRAYENRAIANMLMSRQAFPKNTNIDATLDLYFQTCSITTNTETVAIMAGTLANCGVCPVNGEEVITPDIVQNCLTLMSTCGMYDFSGCFAFEVGIPAKSGVSGCMLLSIPGIAGIAIWSPPLDKKGNSVKGVEVSRKIIQRYPNFHTYYNIKSRQCEINEDDIIDKQIIDKQILVQKLIYTSSTGDIAKVDKILKHPDINIDDIDYDSRTALHLAAAEGHFDLVKYLVEHGATIDIKDRSGNTPYSESTLHIGEKDSFQRISSYLYEIYYNKQINRSENRTLTHNIMDSLEQFIQPAPKPTPILDLDIDPEPKPKPKPTPILDLDVEPEPKP